MCRRKNGKLTKLFSSLSFFSINQSIHFRSPTTAPVTSAAPPPKSSRTTSSSASSSAKTGPAPSASRWPPPSRPSASTTRRTPSTTGGPRARWASRPCRRLRSTTAACSSTTSTTCMRTIRPWRPPSPCRNYETTRGSLSLLGRRLSGRGPTAPTGRATR